MPLRHGLVAPALAVGLLACLPPATGALLFQDDFSTDPNAAGRWITHRHGLVAGSEGVWKEGAFYLHDRHALAAAAFAPANLTATEWTARFRFFWGEWGAHDGNVVFLFYKEQAAYLGRKPAAMGGLGFMVHDPASGSTSGAMGYGVALCGGYCPAPPGSAAPAGSGTFLLQTVVDPWLAFSPATAASEAWHKACIAYDDGQVEAWVDGSLWLRHALPPPGATHPGFGFSAGTDGAPAIAIDDVLVETGDLAGGERADCASAEAWRFGDGGSGGAGEPDPLPGCPQVQVDPPNDRFLVRVGDALRFTLRASGEADPRIVLSAPVLHPPLPAAATFDPTSGAFEWRPGEADAGAYLVRFRAERIGEQPCASEVGLLLRVLGEVRDLDQDGTADAQDNCPDAPNRGQEDGDLDGEGDACDGPGGQDEGCAGCGAGGRAPAAADADGDGRPDLDDNCPDAANGGQADRDRDRLGDACDPDLDGDGVADAGHLPDNCPLVPNPGQEDGDRDGTGDACRAGSSLPPQAPVPLEPAAQASPSAGAMLALALAGFAAARRRVRGG